MFTMKRIFLSSLALLIVSGVFAAGTVSLESAMASGNGRYSLNDETIRIDALPATVEDFTNMRNTLARSPKGGYAMFVIAMLTYAKNKDLGIKFFTLIMDMDVLARNPGNPLNVQGYVPNGNTMSLVRQLDTRPYLPGIYIVGTTVENSYAVSLPATIEFRQATVRGEDTVSLYALTTSGNMARPITLRKNSNGLWKATEFSSMFVGASRIPRTQRVDNL